MPDSAPMRFRPPVWIGVLWSAIAVLQLLLVPGRWPWLHALAGVLGVIALVIHFSSRTVLDDGGIVEQTGWKRTRWRWDDVTFLGLRRRGDSYLTVVLSDGRRLRLIHVPADAYPAVRDRFLPPRLASPSLGEHRG